jgi:hypothetical protein
VPLVPYQRRVVDELNELRLKLEKLNQFVETKTFDNLPFDEQKRLLKQSSLMSKYVDVLQDRIVHFELED